MNLIQEIHGLAMLPIEDHRDTMIYTDFYNGLTIKELTVSYNLSDNRIRQILWKTFRYLRGVKTRASYNLLSTKPVMRMRRKTIQ